MSYSITIKEKDRDYIEIPFSTKSFFEKYWSKFSLNLKLSIINEFQYGVKISLEELFNLIDELHIVKRHLKNKDEYKCVDEIEILRRIDFILNEIESISLDNRIIEEVYIG